MGLLGLFLAFLPSTCLFLAVLIDFWSIFGASRGAPTLENHCFSYVKLMFFIKSRFSSWTALGTLLGASWDALGTLLGPSWGSLGRSWALLGPSWGALGRSWGALDARKNAKKSFLLPFWCFLAALGPVLAPLGLIFRPPGQYFSLFLASPGACFAILGIGCSRAVSFKAS